MLENSTSSDATPPNPDSLLTSGETLLFLLGDSLPNPTS